MTFRPPVLLEPTMVSASSVSLASIFIQGGQSNTPSPEEYPWLSNSVIPYSE